MTKPKYTDFTDFILGVTEEIWEGRGIDLLHEHYSEDIIVRSPVSVILGNQNVIHATRQTLSEFPDRRLLGEDVIWEQTGENSWLSSHRLYCTATHQGYGTFGRPSDKKVAYRVIADCHAENCPKWGWKINDEWIIRDFSAILKSLGTTAKDYALEWGGEFAGFHPDDEFEGPYSGTGNDAEPGLAYEDLLQRIMSDDFAAISKLYDPACQLELPGGVTSHGIGEAERFWLGLKASFPRAEFRVEHRIGRTDDGQCPRAALRWSLRGDHEGRGMFGEPTENPVYIMGMSHAEFGPRGLKREFVLFDEVAVWQQIFDGRIASEYDDDDFVI